VGCDREEISAKADRNSGISYNGTESETLEVSMSLDELLHAVNELDEDDLDQLVRQALLVQAQRRATGSSSEETELLIQINQGIPTALHRRYRELAEKRDAEILSDLEYGELLELSDQIEQLAVERLEVLVKLAALRKVSLDQVMDDLGIQAPSYV
jgi:hypothetical protein